MTLIVNLFGGPGCGKSTTAADIFAKLKWEDINCELVTEYAKDKVWEGNFSTLDDQLYVFAKQHHRQWRLLNKVDIIITDSPLLLSIIYDHAKSAVLHKLVLQRFNTFDNLNFVIDRQKSYQAAGRLQTFEGALEKDRQIKDILDQQNIPYQIVEGKTEKISGMISVIKDRLKEMK